ncbi:NgoMIV family type II restriction endonuclease [Streptomyces sp. SLBN-115]|uniref:NgoMIV family type II restriction endonuclease n=1 Tax=Streptomyces sp. SLBN-115 TaxID=2768453 RepID=UPI00115251DD|nr:NgoMIV family type II restriction endonuclease [Streptomyces sp. SLBN-115]TQJ53346.1 NgoMIV restriction enzyme [Streptomyces sp. SLBN-115]
MSAPFATQLLGWKKLESGQPVPNSADSSSVPSKALAGKILDCLGVAPGVVLPDTPGNPGPKLETSVKDDLSMVLPKSDPSRTWQVDHQKVIAEFSQYTHLGKLKQAVLKNPVLSADLGLDYLIKPDVTVGIAHEPSPDTDPFLHAAVSCKWTIRSDRVQNIRHEFLQMIRHRRGRLPHLVTVTAEPMPSRLAAIARGTGEVDAVYHIAFDALQEAVAAVGSKQQKDDLAEMIGQGRLRPYEELATTLVIW